MTAAATSAIVEGPRLAAGTAALRRTLVTASPVADPFPVIVGRLGPLGHHRDQPPAVPRSRGRLPGRSDCPAPGAGATHTPAEG